jgi:hypothetical protein
MTRLTTTSRPPGLLAIAGAGSLIRSSRSRIWREREDHHG